MTQKRTYKVLAAIQKHDGSGEWFMKIGTGFLNRDNSINLFIDAIPVSGKSGVKLQIRELDERDLAQREAYRANNAIAASRAATADPSLGSTASESIPY